MKKTHTMLDGILIGLNIFFLFGTLFIWRHRLLPQTEKTNSVVPSVSRNEFENIQNGEVASENVIKTEEAQIATSTSVQEKNSTSTQEIPVVVTVIPQEINLRVPFTSQAPEKNWEEPWQDACEEAALLMLDAYYKGYNLSPVFARDQILRMVNWEEQEKEWGRSIEIEKIKEIAEHFAFNEERKQNGEKNTLRVQIVENPTVEAIKRFIANGQPVLVVADGKILPNPHFRNGGPVYHALIIRGYTEDHFITNDPGTQFGENFEYTYDDLMASIRDWNAGDVTRGRRVVMVFGM